jgi:hypothetical protein
MKKLETQTLSFQETEFINTDLQNLLSNGWELDKRVTATGHLTIGTTCHFFLIKYSDEEKLEIQKQQIDALEKIKIDKMCGISEQKLVDNAGDEVTKHLQQGYQYLSDSFIWSKNTLLIKKEGVYLLTKKDFSIEELKKKYELENLGAPSETEIAEYIQYTINRFDILCQSTRFTFVEEKLEAKEAKEAKEQKK